MDWEALKKKYPQITNIKTQEDAREWSEVLPPEEQKILQERWEISPEEENEKNYSEKEEKNEKVDKEEKEEKKGHRAGGYGAGKAGGAEKNEKVDKDKEEIKKDSNDIDQPPESAKNGLKDYASLEKNPPKEEKDVDIILEKHKDDNFSSKTVSEFEKESGIELGVKEVRSTPPINRVTAVISSIKSAPEKIKEYLGLHRLSDEALPNIAAKNDELQKKIEKKWELIQGDFPETKNFKTEDEFKKWESSLPPERKKSLQDKWLSSGNSGIISLNDAYAYKRVSELGNDNLAKKTPNIIFKLSAKFFRPKPTTSAITKDGKTDQEYSKQFNTQSSATKKSILRNEKKRLRKLKKRERKENLGKKPENYNARFKRMYSYLFGNKLKNTPIDYAAANVASQEYNRSIKNNNPIQAAVAVQEIEELVPLLSPNEPPSSDEEETESSSDGKEPANATPSTHSPSNLKRQLSNLQQGQNNDDNNRLHKRLSGKGKEAARKLGKKAAYKSQKGLRKLSKAKPKKIWYKRIGPRCGCIVGFEIILIVIFIAVIIVCIAALIFSALPG